MELLFLDDLGLLVEELHLSVLLHCQVALVVHLAAHVTAEDALRDHHTALHFLELPLDAQHAPVSLDAQRRQSLLLAVLLSLASISVKAKEGAYMSRE